MSHLHAHLVIGGDNGAVVEVVLLYEEGHQVHVLEDQVRLAAHAEVLGLQGQQLACRLKGAHLKVLPTAHLVLQHKSTGADCLVWYGEQDEVICAAIVAAGQDLTAILARQESCFVAISPGCVLAGCHSCSARKLFCCYISWLCTGRV